MLYVSEIFHSLQGEGPQLGKPAVFLRTAGCNLRCTWCDTPYALERRQGEAMNAEDIVEQIRSFETSHLVITGGEPFIQQEVLKEVLEQLEGFFVEIETNGAYENHLDEYLHQINCSPKLSGSGNKSYDLKLLPNNKTWYKFVVGDDEDVNETLEYIQKYELPKERVLLMPLGENSEEIRERSLWLAEICKQQNFRFTPRLHVFLWGNTKGT